LSEPLGDRRRTACASAFLGHVERERGHPDEAAAHYRYARATYEQLDNERGVAWAACDLGLLLTGQGELEPAEELLREALLWFEALDYPWAIAVAACGLAVVRARAGDADEGAALAVRAHRLHAEVGDVRGVAQSLEALAEVGLVRGLAATAARLLGAAAAARDRVAAHPTAAEREAASRVAATLGRQLGKAEAEREHRAGRSLHAPAVQALIDLVIGPADEDGPDAAGLTGRQLEVAALVAAGRTNRQISRELGISEKTTELHVRNAMQRLGVQNRAGIAAWMARQPS
jgi:non-specific serine/threonine protein kinase